MKLQLKAALLATFLIASSTSGAFADTFSPQNDPPTIAGLVVPNALAPAHPRSISTYTVSATVGSQATVANIKYVDICWYNKDSGTADSFCANASTDPINEFHMRWTENGDLQTGGPFSVTGNNNYANSGSSAEYGDGTGLTMDIHFKFKVSEAMHFGSNWSLHVWVTDDQDQTSQEDNAFNEWFVDGLSVTYFGQVSTARSAHSFGELRTGEYQLAENISSGTYRANGNSHLTIEATDFTYLTQTLSLQNYPPSTGFVSLRCNPGQIFNDGGSINVLGIADIYDYSNFAAGTGEGVGTPVEHSCRLDFGGGAQVANVAYSNTVTLAIINGF